MAMSKQGGSKKAKPILKKGRYQGKPSTASPPSRGVTFESEDERRNTLARWKEAQTVFRAEMEVLWREQEKLRKSQELRVSYKMVTFFIIGFLMVIPFMSSYQDGKYESSVFSNTAVVISKGVNLNQTTPHDSDSDSHAGSESTNSPISMNQDGSSTTMMVSVSHVDYSILPMPKSVTLRIDPTIPQDGCKPLLGQELQVFQTSPMWALQLPNPSTGSQIIAGSKQQSPLSILKASESSWTTIALVRQEAPVDNANDLFPAVKNETIVAVALMINDKNTLIERDGGRLRALASSKNTASFPLNFVGLPWESQEERGDTNSLDHHVSYEIRLAQQGACATKEMPIGEIREWWYTVPLESATLPPTSSISIPDFPAHAIEASESDILLPIRRVFYFGHDSSFLEMTRYDQFYRSQISSLADGTYNDVGKSNATQLKERQSLRIRAKKFLKSIQILTKRKQDNDDLELFDNKPLSLETLSVYLKHLEIMHGQALRAATDEPTYLVIGSSIHDVRKYSGEQTRSGDTLVLEDEGNKRRFLRRIRNLNEQIISPEQEAPMIDTQRSEGKKNHNYDHEHILVCHELIERLRVVFPGIQLIWRLPLYVPFDDKKALWEAEKAMMDEWNIPTLDLYTLSYAAWATKQMTSPSIELEDLYHSGLFKEAALKALIPDDEDSR